MEKVEYTKIMMLQKDNILFAIPSDRRMELYLYYWFLNCKPEVKKALKLKLIFDSVNKNYANELMKKYGNLSNNNELAIMNKAIKIMYSDERLWQYQNVKVQEYIKQLKKKL